MTECFESERFYLSYEEQVMPWALSESVCRNIEKDYKLAMYHALGCARMLVKYWAENEFVARLNEKMEKVVKLISNKIEYFEVDSAWST